MLRLIFRNLSKPLIVFLRPVKIYAYKTRFYFIKNLVLEITGFFDFVLVFLNIQNAAMLLHWKAYKGNFIFGRGVMVTDYLSLSESVVQPTFRSNNFMGVGIVGYDSSAFSTNTGMINQCPPIREAIRHYIGEQIFTERVRGIDYQSLRAQCAEILADWSHDEQMATSLAIRSTVMRMFLKLLGQTQISKIDADSISRSYIRRFVELSLFSRYFPFVCGVLGTHQGVRKDAYLKLREYGINNMVVDMTLFAALFSVGTLVLQCVENVAAYSLDYSQLDHTTKRSLAIESVRLAPTVTSTHRIVEKSEKVNVFGQTLTLSPGDEIVYPFLCANRDPAYFHEPEVFKLNRPTIEQDRVLSWSKGPHECPAKELSIIATIVMLDELSERYDLRNLKIFNPAF